MHTCGYHDDQVRYVCQVTATDWDAGENGRLYYSIPDSMASVFHVDQRGVISAHESIDRERYHAFRFPVLAVDSASKSRKTGSALVIITVADVNDESPVFIQPTYLFTVDENQPAATLVCISHSVSHLVCQSVSLSFLLANVNSSSCSLYVIDGPSVCLSVCLSSVCRLSSVCNVGAPYSGD